MINEQSALEKKKPLAAYLVGVRRKGMSERETVDHLAELEELVRTYGVPIAGSASVNLLQPNPAFLVGTGKVKEIAEHAGAHDATLIVFDDDLSPLQQRNWERETKLAVIDRQEVILGIFADRARTREAALQVELARAEYSLPRLTRQWSHLERQRGGGGARGGAGEMQLEVDRRLVRERIQRLKREIEHVRRVRATQRREREARSVPAVAIVGYTNAGKSSLMRAITGAEVLVENKLFATLDTTTRKIDLPDGRPAVLTDTVGFIRKLPHSLVDAFKATLEETQLATALVHVVDASHPNAEDHVIAADAVLEELEALGKPTILVLNKVDLVEDRAVLNKFHENRDHVVETSVLRREGLNELLERLASILPRTVETVFLRIPADQHEVLSLVHREGRVLHEHYEDDVAVVEALVPPRWRHRVEPFIAAAETRGE